MYGKATLDIPAVGDIGHSHTEGLSDLPRPTTIRIISDHARLVIGPWAVRRVMGRAR